MWYSMHFGAKMLSWYSLFVWYLMCCYRKRAKGTDKKSIMVGRSLKKRRERIAAEGDQEVGHAGQITDIRKGQTGSSSQSKQRAMSYGLFDTYFSAPSSSWNQLMISTEVPL
uniref:Uncharacterized protein n=1 Tax=Micrurus carvalhoi TaxID=3147026 RepID=A0A2H6N1U9_9SAUR